MCAAPCFAVFQCVFLISRGLVRIKSVIKSKSPGRGPRRARRGSDRSPNGRNGRRACLERSPREGPESGPNRSFLCFPEHRLMATSALGGRALPNRVPTTPCRATPDKMKFGYGQTNGVGGPCRSHGSTRLGRSAIERIGDKPTMRSRP